ncbi:MAG: branched-chain amino acid ABC transporter permease [Actinomycetota bacterium]
MTAAVPVVEVTFFGLSAGAVIGLLALGLVLIYRTTGVLNLGHWAIGLLSVVAYIFITGAGVPAPLAVVVALPFSVAGGIAAYRWVFRKMSRSRQILMILVAVGVAQTYSSLAALTLRFEAFTRLEPWLPVRDWELMGVNVRSTDLVTAAAGIAVAVGFLVWFRRARAGRALRAVAQNREAALLAGIDEERASMLAWGIGSGLSALALLLVLPHVAGAQGGLLTAFDVSPLGTLLIPAFGAALVGGLVNLPMALVGGFVFGLTRELLVLAPKPWSDLRPSVAAILIVILLLLRTERLFASRQELEALES